MPGLYTKEDASTIMNLYQVLKIRENIVFSILLVTGRIADALQRVVFVISLSFYANEIFGG